MKPNRIHVILASLAALVLGCCSSCKTSLKVNTAQLASDAKSVLGKVAVSELQSLASGELGSDWQHAAAAAAWKAVQPSDIQQLVKDATGNDAVATAATNLATKAVAGGVTKADAIHAVASVLSESAFASAPDTSAKDGGAK